ncbi:MAG: DUF1778 domain-containing protein [Planctomycetota bacterium]
MLFHAIDSRDFGRVHWKRLQNQLRCDHVVYDLKRILAQEVLGPIAGCRPLFALRKQLALYGILPYTGLVMTIRSRELAMESKSARIETRLSTEQKTLIERAAAYLGRSVSDFVLGNAEQAAKAVIEEHERIQLDRIQSRKLVDSLLSPPSPNKELRAAAKEHHKKVTSR